MSCDVRVAQAGLLGFWTLSWVLHSLESSLSLVVAIWIFLFLFQFFLIVIYPIDYDTNPGSYSTPASLGPSSSTRTTGLGMRQTVFFMLTISMPAIPGYYFLAAVLKCCDIQPKTMDMRRADHRSLQVLPQVAYITCNSAHPVSLLVTPGFRLASQNTTATREQAGQPCRSNT